jgi:hypothetical protein
MLGREKGKKGKRDLAKKLKEQREGKDRVE